MKRLLPVLALVVGFALGWVVGGRPGRTPAPRATEFMVTMPDGTDPTGTRTTEYSVYRVTSDARGLSGELAPPAVRPTIVTVIGRDRVTYYGSPKR